MIEKSFALLFLIVLIDKAKFLFHHYHALSFYLYHQYEFFHYTFNCYHYLP